MNATIPTNDNYMSAEAAVTFLGLKSKVALYSLCKRRVIPFVRLKRRLLFSRHELDAHLQARRVAPFDEVSFTARNGG